jgi:hypothetical protein
VDVSEIIELAKRTGAVPSDEVRGLTPKEVGQIRQANAHGLALPATYEQFLIHAGRSFGSIGRQFQMCYPEILEVYTDAYDYSEGVLSILDERDMLFGQNIGHSWYWLRVGEADPAVMGYSETFSTLEGKMIAPSFSRWLELVVTAD